MAIPVADALCDWVRPGHSCCRHDHTRNCVNKSAARDEKVNALLVSAGGGTCAAQKRTGGGREGAKNGMLLCASTGISCLHIVTESGHVGAAFCDPKVAHGHIVYAAPHVLDCGVPPGFVELNARALARGVKGEGAPRGNLSFQIAYVVHKVALPRDGVVEVNAPWLIPARLGVHLTGGVALVVLRVHTERHADADGTSLAQLGGQVIVVVVLSKARLKRVSADLSGVC